MFEAEIIDRNIAEASVIYKPFIFMPLQACTVEAKYMFSLCPLSDCLSILMTCANMDLSAGQMGQASPLHKCCGRSITWPQAVFSSLVSALLCICLCIMLALWFALAAPVAGVSSSDDLVTFTAPEITLPVSYIYCTTAGPHFCHFPVASFFSGIVEQ